MFNKKAIVISGFSRGGTNIIWNILQSHPQICSAQYETNALFSNKNLFLNYLFRLTRRLKIDNNSLARLAIDYWLYRIKMTNFNHHHNKYLKPNKIYTKREVSKTAICFKSVDHDIDYTKQLLNIYPDLFFLALVRNGYALVDGHKRRGAAVKDIAMLYQSIADKMQAYSESLNHYKLIKFENVVNDVFSVSKDLFMYLETEPYDLDHLRLKSKKIVGKDGSHDSVYGAVDEKYWFTRETITNAIDTSINDKQIGGLSSADIKCFNRYAKSALNYFGYEILN